MANPITSIMLYVLAIMALIYMLLTYRLSRRKVCKLLAIAAVTHIITFYTFFIFFGGYPVITPAINGWSSGVRAHEIITFVLMASTFQKGKRHG